MVPFAEGRITRLRRELKLVVEAGGAEEVAALLAREAAPVESRIAAVYFDAADGRLARKAAATPGDCVKLRAKCYDPDLGAVPGRAVLELKRERGGTVLKDRLWVARAEVRRALEGFAPRALAPLTPVVATTYRRRVFQAAPAWRATLDVEIEFHAASWEIVAAASWRAALPPPFAAEPRAVVELKFAEGALPSWLSELAAGAAAPYSKFAEAMAHAGRGRSRGA